ncbi:MAG: ABC transporter ATP-binding protein [Candidatus Geothermincolia bacterium]
MAAIVISDLHKSYGQVKAVNGLSLEISENEIFGILGPNGAGKTTTLEMIETLRVPDSGSITVLGMDVLKESKAVKELLGVQLQNTVFFDNLSVWETIDLFGSFYSKQIIPDTLLDLVDLTDKAGARLNELSGGQQKRVSIALALVNDPRVVFLDEPTTGLDPQARRHIWEIVKGLRERDKTVVLTTHYIEEAEFLCDRVAVMDQGVIVALDTPNGLIYTHAPESNISFRMQPAISEARVLSIPGVGSVSRNEEGQYAVTTLSPQESLAGIFQAAYEERSVADEISMRRATLEDVFLKITGRSLRE